LVLQGGPASVKASLMRAIASLCTEASLHTENLHSPMAPDALNGLIISPWQIGVVDGDAYQLDSQFQQGVTEVRHVDLEEAYRLSKNEIEQIALIRNKIHNAYSEAYDGFGDALRIHDQWEVIYIKNLLIDALNHLTTALAQRCFQNEAREKPAACKHRFLGAATPSGAVDFVPNLTGGLKKRYLIKGRPGTGKSTLLGKLASEAQARGLDTEIYHCGLDPRSLDMVIVRELDLAILDSTAPHEYFPSRDGDEIVDVYEAAVNPGTDETYREPLQEIISAYKAKIQEATDCLAMAKYLEDSVADIYAQSANAAAWNAIQDDITRQLGFR